MRGLEGADDRLARRTAVVDDEDAAALAGSTAAAASGPLMPSCAACIDRVRNSSSASRKRESERTRARRRISSIGLVRKSSAAGLKAGQPVGGLIESRDHDDGDMPGRRIGFQAAADLESVHPRHHHVEQNDVAIAGGADFQGVRAVGAGDDVEIVGAEARFEKFEIGEGVVDDENARGHIAPFPARARAGAAAARQNWRKTSLLVEIEPDRLDEFDDRNWLGEIGFAAALADLLFVALHRKGGDGDDRGYGSALRPL